MMKACGDGLGDERPVAVGIEAEPTTGGDHQCERADQVDTWVYNRSFTVSRTPLIPYASRLVLHEVHRGRSQAARPSNQRQAI